MYQGMARQIKNMSALQARTTHRSANIIQPKHAMIALLSNLLAFQCEDELNKFITIRREGHPFDLFPRH
jgi:hypothetical protein